jgi:signal transduction histidine kinase
LAIVRRALERMGGEAGFQPGSHGARFWVELPVAGTDAGGNSP